jgi:chromosome partitioning protein
MKIITLLNEKGGVGKTTLAVHIAAGLAARGERVVLVDADAQGHATVMLGMLNEPALHDLLVREASFKDTLRFVAQEVYAPHGESQGQLFLLPGDTETRVIPMLVSDVWKMRKRFHQLESAVDYVVIDTAPTPSLFHSMIYLATDAIIYPTKSERLSFDGLMKSFAHTEEANESRKPHFDPIQQLGIVPTMHRSQTVEHEENLKVLKQQYGAMVWEALPMRITWAEATSLSQTVYAAAPDSHAAKDGWTVVDKVRGAA